jgi:hypothetical protein
LTSQAATRAVGWRNEHQEFLFEVPLVQRSNPGGNQCANHDEVEVWENSRFIARLSPRQK